MMPVQRREGRRAVWIICLFWVFAACDETPYEAPQDQHEVAPDVAPDLSPPDAMAEADVEGDTDAANDLPPEEVADLPPEEVADLPPEEVADLPPEEVADVPPADVVDVPPEEVVDAVEDTGPEWAEGPYPVRVMAANISSGNYQSYDPGHGIRIFQGLDPDVVLIQEFNYANNTTSDIRRFVDTAFGPGFYYVRGRGQIPNGVVSRYPILESGYWPSNEVSNRDWDWAVLDLPGGKDLLAVSVHLHTDRNAREMPVLRDRIAAKNLNNRYYLVLGGDFNTDSRTAARTHFNAIVEANGPYPVDNRGVEGTNASRTKPYDWVLACAAFESYEVSVAIGANAFPEGLVFDSRVYTPLIDVSPVLVGDSGAPQMQHMAVVRDFHFRL